MFGVGFRRHDVEMPNELFDGFLRHDASFARLVVTKIRSPYDRQIHAYPRPLSDTETGRNFFRKMVDLAFHSD
jgi:hypothetical protein